MDRIDLERMRYWQGQALRSGDLNDQLSYEAQKRWWHNRALHDAFGIAFGLEVAGPHGENGTYFVTVEPGVAYDAFGRELVLVEEERVALPELSPGNGVEVWTLLARLPVARDCAARPQTTRPVMFWKRADQVLHADGVPLAHAKRIEATLTLARIDEVLPTVRLRKVRVKALNRPKIGGGSTTVGATNWVHEERVEALRLHSPAPGVVLIKVDIDTSAAGFTEVPCYFVSLQGSLAEADRTGATRFFSDNVAATAQSHFTYTVTLSTVRKPRVADPGAKILLAARRHLHVAWLGIQMCCGTAHTREVENGIR